MRPKLFAGSFFGEEFDFDAGIVIRTRFGKACLEQKVHIDHAIGKAVCVVFVSLGSAVGWGDGRMNEKIGLRIGRFVVFDAQHPHYGLGYKEGDDDVRILLNVHRRGLIPGSGEQCSTHQFT